MRFLEQICACHKPDNICNAGQFTVDDHTPDNNYTVTIHFAKDTDLISSFTIYFSQISVSFFVYFVFH